MNKNLNCRHALIGLFFFLGTDVFSQTYPRGILPGVDAKYGGVVRKAPLTRSFYEKAPMAFSLKRYAPIAASQSHYGTCTGWAVGYAARTIIEAQANKWTDKQVITRNAFSPTFQYRSGVMAGQTDSLCGGAYTTEVVESLKTIGSVPSRDFKVPAGTELCPAVPLDPINHTIAAKYKVEDYVTLWSREEPDSKTKTNLVKTSLSEGNPVVISMICPISFDTPDPSGVWNPTEDPDSDSGGRMHGRHAMCVVGYDNSKFGGAFEVQNSWGASWGNNGFVWIRYDDFARFTYQAFELIQFPSPEPAQPYLAGGLRLFDMDDRKFLEVALAPKTRNWNVVGPGGIGEYTYRVVPSLVSGTKMRMYLKSDQAAYVYVLGTGSVDTSIKKLFPVGNISPALSYTGSEVAIPSEDYYFEMDETVGKDYIVMLYSKEKLNFDAIVSSLSRSTGTIAKRLSKTMQSKLIKHQYIDFKRDEINFNVRSTGGGDGETFAMILEFDHVN